MHLPDSHETRAQRVYTKITTFYLSTPPVFLSQCQVIAYRCDGRT